MGNQFSARHPQFSFGHAARPTAAVTCNATFAGAEADENKQNSTPKEDWDISTITPQDAPRAVHEYLDILDDAACGAASEVDPKFTSHSDPASQWTASCELNTM